MLLFVLSLGLAACGDGEQDANPPAAPTAPEGLHYEVPSAIYVVGEGISPNQPRSSGGKIDRYVIEPSLPEGLVLDADTGVISGTPIHASTATSYVVSGSNSAGIATTRLTIEVVQRARPPESLTYSVQEAIYTVGHTIPPNFPTLAGGAADRYAIAPTLPIGLTLDARTGVIDGTPEAPSAATEYSVTASNEEGAVQTKLSIAVQEPLVAPSKLYYEDPAPIYIAGQAIAPNMPTIEGGPVARFAVSPALPVGLSLNSQTGIIAGTAEASSAKRDYTIVAENGAGSAKSTITLTVAERDTWVAGPALATPRSGLAAAALQPNMLLVAGGSAYPAGPVKDVELYDGIRWIQRAPMHYARHGHAAVRLNDGRVLVAGATLPGEARSYAEVYDPELDRWTLTAPLPPGWELQQTIAMLLPDGRVVAISDALVTVYSPLSDQWSLPTMLPTPRNQFAAAVLMDGKVLVSGGYVAGSLSRSAEIYDPNTGTVAKTSDMTTFRAAHTLSTLPDGRVLAIGGAAMTEVYDPLNDTWTRLFRLATDRQYHTASLAPNGNVLIAGGVTTGGDTLVLPAEIVDVANGSSRVVGELAYGRTFHSATVMRGDRVVVTGGGHGLIERRGETEIFMFGKAIGSKSR